MRNRYWPAFYLVDRDGGIVLAASSELHRGEQRGDAMEAAALQFVTMTAGRRK